MNGGNHYVSPAARRAKGWSLMAVALAGLAAFVALLAGAPRLPGMAGRVIEHNLRHGIQATALFYADIEAMAGIEAALLRLLELEKTNRRCGP